jgi:SEC-C motif
MPTSQTELLARYQQIRQIGLKLNHMLVERLDKSMLEEGARELDMLRGGVMVFDSEDMTSVLMDYCIHDVRRQGRTVIEAMLAEGRFPAGSDEWVYLNAIREAKYGIFFVERIEPGIGVDVLDVIRGNRLRIVDINFSRSAQPGLALAARICAPGEFIMTTGAALPLGLLEPDEQAAYVRELENARGPGLDELAPSRRSKDIAKIIRTALRKGAGERIAYKDAGRRPRTQANSPTAPKSGLGRNDPCPCGSGQKYKRCCGRRK